jgi:hypothetical protein
MKNWKIILDSPFFMFCKKHLCPKCSAVLTTKKVKKVVNSKSEEAKFFNFSSDSGGYLFGDVEFTWYVFHCEKCNVDISLQEMKVHEKAIKKYRIQNRRK